jgi:hypothetical protein
MTPFSFLCEQNFAPILHPSMRQILGYIRQYIRKTNKGEFALSTLFIALCIFVNYRFGMNGSIRRLSEVAQYASWLAVFGIVYGFGYSIQALFYPSAFMRDKRFLFLLLAGPAIFAWKMAYNVHIPLGTAGPVREYWNQVLYWPFKLLVVGLLVYVIWKMYEGKGKLYGFSSSNSGLKPYFFMLLLMVPLVALASTQPDFLTVYPKLRHMQPPGSPESIGLYQVLFELSYGSDFLTIELFFRGFLVLAFARWVGTRAILPMALFYCAIHFGKPLGECISSYFGGLLLGIITYHTRSIWGGLIIHLGIAWLMELGGYVGRAALSS